jgi:hypothetical protein
MRRVAECKKRLQRERSREMEGRIGFTGDEKVRICDRGEIFANDTQLCGTGKSRLY